MKNVFGYPEFDAEGEEILCTYDNAYSDMLMDTGLPDGTRPEEGLLRRGEETAVLLLSGTVTFGWEGGRRRSAAETCTDGPLCPPCLRRGGDHRGAQTDAEIRSVHEE